MIYYSIRDLLSDNSPGKEVLRYSNKIIAELEARKMGEHSNVTIVKVTEQQQGNYRKANFDGT